MIRNILPLNRALIVLALVLGGLLVGLEGGGVIQHTVEPLFPEFRGARATSVLIAVPAARGAADGTTVTITRATLAEPWTVGELFGAPAAPLLIDGLFARIGEMTTLDLVSEDPERIGEYELGEDEAIRLTVESAVPAAVVDAATGEMVAGDSSSDGRGDIEVADVRLFADVFVARGPGSAAFVRRAGDAKVYRIARMPMPPTAAFGWFDRRALMPLENVQIARFVARGPALGDGVEVVVEQPLSQFGSFQDAVGRDLPRDRVLDLLHRMRTLFPVGVIERRESGELDPATVSFEVEIEPRTGNVFRLVFGPLDRPGGESGGGGEPATLRNTVSAMRSGRNLVVECDGRAIASVLQALRALARE